MVFVVTALLFLATCFAQQLTDDKCYIEYLNTKVVCLDPWETCKDVASCKDCRDICTSFKGICQAIQYQESTKECIMYRVAVNPIGYKPPALGRRKRGAGCYGNSPPSLNRNAPDFTYYVVSNNSNCNNAATTAPPPQPTYGPPTQPPTYAPPPTQAPTYAPPTQAPVVTTEIPPPPTQPPAPPPTQPPTDAPIGSTPIPPPPTQGPLPQQALCPEGKSAIFVENKGYQLSGNPDSQFQATSEQACTQACIANQLPTGISAPCQSVDYNPTTSQCNIFLNASPPAGTATLAKTADFNHFEKTCFDTAVVQACPGPIVKDPQHILVGYAESVLTATSQTDCTTQCLQSQQRFGFVCKSGLYYYQDAANNCILNSESATTQPALYTEETTDKVDYFEPICIAGSLVAANKKSRPTGTVSKPTAATNTKPTAIIPKRNKRAVTDLKPQRKRNIIWANLPNWGSWTRCDGQASARFHYRNCKSFNPNNCEVASEPCDPNDRAKEIEEIANEELGIIPNGGGVANGTVDVVNGGGSIDVSNSNSTVTSIGGESKDQGPLWGKGKEQDHRRNQNQKEREDREQKEKAKGIGNGNGNGKGKGKGRLRK